MNAETLTIIGTNSLSISGKIGSPLKSCISKDYDPDAKNFYENFKCAAIDEFVEIPDIKKFADDIH